MKQQSLMQLMVLGLLTISLALVMVGCNGASNPFSQLTQDEIEITVEVGEPIQVKQPVPVTITVVTKEDIPGLKVALADGGLDVQVIDGFLDFWVVDTVAQQPLIFTTTIKLTRRGHFNIIAFAQDPSIARVVSGSVSLEITNEGAVVNPTPDKNRSDVIILSSTLTINTTPSPIPSPTPIPRINWSIGDLNLSIPDDNTWLTFPFSITNISTQAVVSSVSIKFLIDHPHGEELTVELIGPDYSTNTRLWERQTVGPDNIYEDSLYVNHLNLSIFNGLPVAGEWQLRVRDEVVGNIGTLEIISLQILYTLPPNVPAQPTFVLPTPTASKSQSLPNTLPNVL